MSGDESDVGESEEEIVDLSDDEDGSMTSENSEEEARRNEEEENILNRLQEMLVHSSCLHIPRQEDLKVVLDNVDEISNVLSSPTQRLLVLTLGNSETAYWSQLHVDDGNRDAWNRLCGSLSRHDGHIEEVSLGHNVSGECMGDVIRALPNVQHKFRLSLLWEAISEPDLYYLTRALSSQRQHYIELYVTGDRPAVSIRHRLADTHQIISKLFTQPAVSILCLGRISFRQDECRVFGRILSSNVCPSLKVGMTHCAFSDGGGMHIAKGFADNTKVKRLNLTGVFGDELFRKALQEFLPSNSSIEELRLWDTGSHANVFDIIKKIAIKNDTIRSLTVDHYIHLNASIIKDLYEAFQRNYSLVEINFGQEQPFQTITDLNRAGRRYLKEEPSPRRLRACSNLLGNDLIRSNVAPFYFHLRENPEVLLNNGVRSNRRVVHGKREADEETGTEPARRRPRTVSE